MVPQLNTKHRIVIDFETYYSRRDKYSLSSMTAVEYIMDPRFEVIMVSVKVDNEPTVWMDGRNHIQLSNYLRSLPWSESTAVAHNGAFFDFLILYWVYGIIPQKYADTLLMARPLLGAKERASLAALCKFFGLTSKGNAVTVADGQRREDISDAFMADYAAYCCGDTDRCAEIFDRLVNYWRPVDMDWMHLCCRMMAVPQIQLNKSILEAGLQKEIQKKTDVLDDLLNQMQLSQIIIPEEARKPKRKSDPPLSDREAIAKIVGSTQQCAELMERFGCPVPEKYSDKQQKMVPALAKSDHEFTSLVDSPIPGIPELVAARLGIKSTIMQSRIERFLSVAQRMDGGYLPVPIVPFAAHCVPGDTEVLTPGGWVRLDAWTAGPIMQYSAETGKLTMLPGIVYRGPEVKGWVHQNSSYGQAPMTLGHTVPYFLESGDKLKVGTCKAQDLLTRSRTRLVECGEYNTPNPVDISEHQARVLAMVQADGNFQVLPTGNVWLRLSFRKKCKIQRCRELLDRVSIVYSDRKEYYQGKSKTTFVIRVKDLPNWLNIERKQFGPWCLRLSLVSMQAIIDEVKYWDGTIKADGTVRYASSIHANVEWLSTMGALCNRPTGRISDTIDARTGNKMYCLALRPKSRYFCLDRKRVVYAENEVSRAWCAFTITGFWLARHHGKIFITGNTGRCGGTQKINVQNLSARKSTNNPDGKRNAIRLAMEAPPGYFMVDGDLSQIEVRTLGAISGEQNILRPFSIKGFDPYCDFGRKFYGYDIDPERDKDKRQGMKAAVLGNGYGQGPAGYQIYARSMGAILDMEEAEAIVKTYRREHPKVVELWRQCDTALNWIETGREGTFGYKGCLRVYKNAIVLPSGRAIYYRGLQYRQVWDNRTGSYKRERMFYDPIKHTYRRVYGSLVTENVTQGVAADVIYEMGVDLSKRGLNPALQVHDSLVFVVPDTSEWRQYARTTIPACMRTVPKWLPWLPLDSSYEEGPNYGETEGLKEAA